jgi:hypothetical protein
MDAESVMGVMGVHVLTVNVNEKHALHRLERQQEA